MNSCQTAKGGGGGGGLGYSAKYDANEFSQMS